MAWSGLLILVVKCVGKLSPPEGGLIIWFLVFSTIIAGFGIHRENEDSDSNLICKYYSI